MTAVFAADAVARLSGTVGVAAVTAGPGKFAVKMFVSPLTSVIYLCLKRNLFILI